MSQTTISANSPQAARLIGVALFTQTQQQNTKLRMMAGPKPTMAEVGDKVSKQQSSSSMPLIEIYDLANTAGQSATVDCFNILSAQPIMGSKNAQGLGTPLSFSNMELGLNQWTFPVSGGDNLSQQRTTIQLRELARLSAPGLVSRYWEQRHFIHAAGARGSQMSNDWTIPLESDLNYGAVMINPVKAPTFNRHYVVSGTDLIQGGQQLGSISSTDSLKLIHLDGLRNIIDTLPFTLQSVKYDSDYAAVDSSMWVYFAPPGQFSSLLQEGALRTFQANAKDRATYFKDNRHPLFAGECGMWNGILVIKQTRAVIRFLRGDSTNIVTAANATTATESAQTVNGALTAGYEVQRGILMGAQALACVYGRDSRSGTHYSWSEVDLNHGRDKEFAVYGIEGSAKIRFDVPNEFGVRIPTDNGIIVVDAATKTVNV